MTNKKETATYLNLRQFAAKHTFISYGALRQVIHHNKDFDKACVRRLGKRVLINEQKALEYIENFKY